METQIVVIAGTVFTILLVLAVLVIILAAERKKTKLSLHLAQTVASMQHKLIRSTIDAHEVERRRIGMDLHDDLGQTLTAALLTLEEFDQKIESRTMIKVRSHLNSAITSCTAISRNLYPVVLDKMGLNAGLDQLLRTSLENSKISYTLNLEDTELSKDAVVHVYRIIQELINNTRKHAKATTIKITISDDGNGYYLLYTDNGIGFKVDNQTFGIGLETINFRSKLLNGTLTLSSSNKTGFNLKLYLPYEKA